MEAQEIHRGRLFDHVQLVVRDLAASQAFYTAVLQALQVPLGGADEIYFWADELFVSSADSPAAQGHLTGRTHLAFQAQDRAMVDAFYKAALAHGGTDNGAPGERAKSLFQVFLESHKSLAGMGCKAHRAANSPCYWQAVQRRRPPGKALARRVGVKSGDWTPRLLAWARAHAAHPKHPLTPIALQCDLQKHLKQALATPATTRPLCWTRMGTTSRPCSMATRSAVRRR